MSSIDQIYAMWDDTMKSLLESERMLLDALPPEAREEYLAHSRDIERRFRNKMLYGTEEPPTPTVATHAR